MMIMSERHRKAWFVATCLLYLGATLLTWVWLDRAVSIIRR